jgi:hypothetical protein
MRGRSFSEAGSGGLRQTPISYEFQWGSARPRDYFFSAAASTFLHSAVSLSLDFERQAMIRPPPGATP